MSSPALAPADTTLGKLTLCVRGPAGTTQTVVLTSACCRIGSGEGCTLRLRAPGVRDVHCVISRGPRRTTVRGLAKETWLNGAVFFESPLAVGDCLRLGRLEIDILGDERLPAEAPAGAKLNDGESAPELKNRASCAENGSGDAEPRHAEPVVALPAAPLALDYTEQLKGLVAGQTASLSASSNATLDAELAEVRRELSRQQAEITGLQQQAAATQQNAASSVRQAIDNLRVVEERLAGVDRQLHELASPPAEVNDDSTSARWLETDSRLEQMDRLIEGQRQEAEAFRQRLEETCARLAELAAAVATLEERSAGGSAPQEEIQQLLDQWRREQTDDRAAREANDRRLADLEATLAGLQRASDEQPARQTLREPAELNPVGGTHLVSPEERQAWLAAAASQRDAQEEEGSDHPGDPGLRANEQPASEDASAEQEDAAPERAEEPKELAFEQVSKAAPLSTLDVLRRMGTTIDLTDDDPPVAQPPAEHAPTKLARPLAEHSRLASPPRQSEPASGEHHDDGESIEQYMSQLLGRLRTTKVDDSGRVRDSMTGGTPSPRAAAAVQSPSTKPGTPAPTAAEQPKKQPRLMPRTKEATPRAIPPELSADFSAMRALANNTARQAIDTHQRRGQVRAMQGKLLIAIVALLVSFGLMWFSTGGNHLALWASLLSLLVAGYWIRRYVLLTRKSRAEAKQAAKSDPHADEPAPEAQADAGTAQSP
jgi:hypothetical protein